MISSNVIATAQLVDFRLDSISDELVSPIIDATDANNKANISTTVGHIS